MTEIHCKKCKRFLGSFMESQITVTLKCPACKSLTRYKMVSLGRYTPHRVNLGKVV